MCRDGYTTPCSHHGCKNAVTCRCEHMCSDCRAYLNYWAEVDDSEMEVV